MNAIVTRLAPSPTGALHLGNARTFLVNYLLARRNGWQVLMRVEDLDGPRIKPGSADAMLEELAWLGLTWDSPVIYQSARWAVYRAALERLATAGHAYPCTCSRRDVQQAASAPHPEDASAAYPGTCRDKYDPRQWLADDGATAPKHAAWRIRTPTEPVSFTDELVGTQTFDLSRTCGDFVIFKADGTPAYQLAVVLDDAEAGVNAIVRGDDLLESAARQIHLRRLLNLHQEPRYWHLPLIVGPDGRRLAKRHGDTRLTHYRDAGATPQRILGLLGYWSGLLPTRRPTSMDDLLNMFDVARLPPTPVVFSREDDAFLRADS